MQVFQSLSRIFFSKIFEKRDVKKSMKLENNYLLLVITNENLKSNLNKIASFQEGMNKYDSVNKKIFKIATFF